MRGVLFPFAGRVAPAGFLLCDGTAVSRATYAALFSTITRSFTGTTTLNSNVITAVTPAPNGASGPQIGDPFCGPGVPAGATVTAVAAATITISVNANGNNAGAQLFACPWGVGDGTTTFNVPEVRGEFIRAADQGRGIDANRRVGSTQLDQFQSHRHGVAQSSDRGQAGGGATPAGSTDVASTDPINSSNGANGAVRTGAETRPRNVAATYVIKT